MKALLWIVVAASMMTVISVFAEASSGERAARIAPKADNRLPVSAEAQFAPAPEKMEALPSTIEGASIEVGFSQDNEAEPHLFATATRDHVSLYEIPAIASATEVKSARSPASISADMPERRMNVEVFASRVHQAVDDYKFFTAKQVKARKPCSDHYVLRIKMGNEFRERRGCASQANDPFSGFSQIFFRDAFWAWGRAG